MKLKGLLLVMSAAILASCSFGSKNGSSSEYVSSSISSSEIVSSESLPSISESIVASPEDLSLEEIETSEEVIETSESPVLTSEDLVSSSEEISEVSSATSEEVITSSDEINETSEVPIEESSESSKEESSEEIIASSEEENESSEEIIAASEEIISSSEPIISSSEEVNSSIYEDGKFFISTSDGTYIREEGLVTISSSGTYVLEGELNGRIIVECSEEDTGTVELDLNGVTITCDSNSPIWFVQAQEAKIKAQKGTNNVIIDSRPTQSEEDDTQGNGAIYAKCDLKFVGTGKLTVSSTYNNGIHTTKDLKIQKENLTVTAINNAIKGNDSITISSGTITAISTGGDALKTTNTDLSSKGKQRGNIEITGGTINLYSACDGIDAAYNAVIAEGTEDGTDTSPTINILTNKYSSYTNQDDIDSTSTSSLYLRTTEAYSSSYRYAVRFYNTSIEDGVWKDASYLTSMKIRSGRSSYTNYFYEVALPSGYSSFAVYKFNVSAENSLTSYVAKSSGSSVNSSYDTVQITTSGSSISTGSWGNYDSYTSSQSGQGGWTPGGGNDKNTDKADVSAKGIKSGNEINISGGSLTIKAYDDAIHANYGDITESGLTGVGDVNISGGTLSVYGSDDGIHADRYLNISGGSINVTYSYEGLEGYVITISGGESYVYAKNDAINASKTPDSSAYSSSGVALKVTGGYTFAAVPTTSDSDGVDANGTISVSGGVLIGCGPNNQNMAAIDADSTVSVTGGTLVGFGYTTVNNYSSVTKTSKSGSYSGTKVLNFSNGISITTGKMESTYSGCYAYSANGTLSSIS